MAMFVYNPRVSDEDDLLRLVSELAGPVYDPRELGALRSVGNLAQQLGRWPQESEIQNTDQGYRIRLDLRGQYNPEEVKVSCDDKGITITAKHEERKEKHGSVSRQMVRRYVFPPGVDPKTVTCTMSDQSILHIKAAKQALEAPKEVPIPVEFKG